MSLLLELKNYLSVYLFYLIFFFLYYLFLQIYRFLKTLTAFNSLNTVHSFRLSQTKIGIVCHTEVQIRAGLGQKIGPGIFLVQAAHHHFELYIYIYSRRTCTGPIVRENARYARLPVQPWFKYSCCHGLATKDTLRFCVIIAQCVCCYNPHLLTYWLMFLSQ